MTSLWLIIISFCEGDIGVFMNLLGCLLNYRDSRSCLGFTLGKPEHIQNWGIHNTCFAEIMPIISNEARKGRGNDIKKLINAFARSTRRHFLTCLNCYLIHHPGNNPHQYNHLQILLVNQQTFITYLQFVLSWEDTLPPQALAMMSKTQPCLWLLMD